MTEPADEPTEADPMPVAEVAEIHNQWGGSVYEGAILRLCESHERLRALVGGRSAAPTRDEVRALIAEAMDPVGFELETVDEATDAVMALLSRSAAEPPTLGERIAAKAAEIEEWARHLPPLPPREPDPTAADICACGHQRDEHSRHDGRCYERIDTEQWCPCEAFGVAAEPNEKATDGQRLPGDFLTAEEYETDG